MIGIICMHMITKKYTLAAFENYSERFLGRKVRTVYFEVLTTLGL
jgi:hypothetical protein